ncbi:MAG TPA: uroporphyrinogen decarboxylase family protein [Candidatus Marinimicrobia bacterium]|nr:uroporphyrinogen decarboxylase family protein [Candidatus Neomarinimicrobiota bacterium]HQQ84405.1 uroporphyrinogen decarboxylase family protein [Candidatus Neomarinimicrobiota bacterium]
MTDQQWETLKKVINGEKIEPLPVGFIADSPWLPGWYGIKILDYFSNDELWLKANLKAIQEFPEVMFLPGFWSEFGMCTEPSAFGARCRFPQNEFPHAHPVIKSPEEINALVVPEPETDGLLPFVLNRLKLAQPYIENAGHKIRFAIARGPLNIASFLMGTTEFLMAMLTSPELVETLMEKITAFLKNWLRLQRSTFSTIDGILLLDDIIGFIGEQEFCRFGLPYFKELFSADVSVKFLHNDAQCRVSVPYLPEIGVNLFNMGFDVSLNDIKTWTNNQVTLLGNIPPRDVLANGKPEDVVKSVTELLDSLEDQTRVILSCGGGLPPGVSTENLKAFIETVKNYTLK